MATKQDIDWTHYLVRYMASDNKDALNDLIWSVGGSPPWGGVSYDEAEAMYNLIDNYVGKGSIPDSYFKNAIGLVKSSEQKIILLKAFQKHDEIVSSAETYQYADVKEGLSFATALKSETLIQHFNGLLSQLLISAGNFQDAAELLTGVTNAFVLEAIKDAVFIVKCSAYVQNLCTILIYDGQFNSARTFFQSYSVVLSDEVYNQLAGLLNFEIEEGLSLEETFNHAEDLLDQDQPQALAWFEKAEAIALTIRDEQTLCEIYGDWAVCFKRFGNYARAIEKNNQAIDLSRRIKAYVLLARYLGNLYVLYMMMGKYDESKPLLKEAIEAAISSGDMDQLGYQMSNLAHYYGETKRYYEGIELLENQLDAYQIKGRAKEILYQNLYLLNGKLANYYLENDQPTLAIKALESSLQYYLPQNTNSAQDDANIYKLIASLYEKTGDLTSAKGILEKGIKLFESENKKTEADTLKSFTQELYRVKAVVEKKTHSKQSQEPAGNKSPIIDKETEITKKVNDCILMLQSNPQAVQPVFEETLALVKSMGDKRRELILYVNFVSEVDKWGFPERALSMARLAVDIAETSLPLYRTYAWLNYAELQNMHSADKKGVFEKYYRSAQELAALKESAPDKFDQVIQEKMTTVLNAIQLGLDLNEGEKTDFIYNLVKHLVLQNTENPEPELKHDKSSAIPLKPFKASNDPLQKSLLQWRIAVGSHSIKSAPPVDTLLSQMADFTNRMAWQELTDALGKMEQVDISGNVYTKDGAIQLISLLKDYVDRKITFEELKIYVAAIDVFDDDLMFVSIYVLLSKELNGIAFYYWEMAADLAKNLVIRSRCFHLLAMWSKNPEQQINYYIKSYEVIENEPGANEKISALIEAVYPLINMGHWPEAEKWALIANELAPYSNDIKQIGKAKGTLGYVYMQQKKMELATPVFEQLLQQQQEAGDKEGADTTKINLQACYNFLGVKKDLLSENLIDKDPYACFNKGLEIFYSNELQKAIEYFQKGFALVEKHPISRDEQAKFHNMFGRMLFDAQQMERSADEMKKAIEICEETQNMLLLYDCWKQMAARYVKDNSLNVEYATRALTLGKRYGTTEEQAIDLAQLGQAYRVGRQFDKAVNNLNESLKMQDSINVRNELGRTYLDMGRFEDAKSIFTLLVDKVKTKSEKCVIYHDLGRAYHGMHNFQEAQKYYQASLSAVNEIDSVENRLVLYNNLASMYNDLGDPVKSIEIIESALSINLPDQSTAARSLQFTYANALKLLGNLNEAKTLLDQLAKQARDSGDGAEEAKCLGTLAYIYLSQFNPQKAMATFKEALHAARTAEDEPQAAISLSSIGLIHMESGEWLESIPYFKEASKQFYHSQNWQDYLICEHNLSQTYFALKELVDLQSCHTNLTGVLEKIQPSENKWMKDLLEGEIAILQNNWTDAKESFHRAIAVFETARQKFLSAEEKRNWDKHFHVVYEIALKYALLNDDGKEAMTMFEFSRTRLLNDLKTQIISKPKTIADEVWEEYTIARNSYNELQAQKRQNLFDKSASSLQALNQARSRFEAAKQKVGVMMDAKPLAAENGLVFQEDWIHKLPDHSATFYLQVLPAPTPSGLGVLKIIKHNNKQWSLHCTLTNALETHDLSRLIMGDRDKWLQVKTYSDLDLMPAECLGYNVLQYEVPLRIKEKVIDYTTGFLSDRIWPTLLDDLPENISALVLIPSAGLNILPLHAAKDSSGRLLIGKYKCMYLPGLRLYKTGEASSYESITQIINPTEDLIYTNDEAKAVSDFFDSNAVQRLYGKAATPSEVLNALKASDIFYFTGHGFYDNDNPLQSGLLCAPENAHDRNASLYLETILNEVVAIKTNMVVLSACQSGLVDTMDELNDFVGFPGTFLTAGIRVVLSSQWPVDDRATALLISRFFRYWKQDKVSFAEALCLAQHSLMKFTKDEMQKERLNNMQSVNGKLKSPGAEEWEEPGEDSDHPYLHPYYWASFFLTGY